MNDRPRQNPAYRPAPLFLLLAPALAGGGWTWFTGFLFSMGV